MNIKSKLGDIYMDKLKKALYYFLSFSLFSLGIYIMYRSPYLSMRITDLEYNEALLISADMFNMLYNSSYIFIGFSISILGAIMFKCGINSKK